jgi:hypothetical protein
MINVNNMMDPPVSHGILQVTSQAKSSSCAFSRHQKKFTNFSRERRESTLNKHTTVERSVQRENTQERV